MCGMSIGENALLLSTIFLPSVCEGGGRFSWSRDGLSLKFGTIGVLEFNSSVSTMLLLRETEPETKEIENIPQ